MSKKWDDSPNWYVVGCISHDGAIVGRACGGPADPCGSITHEPEESRGKRWRWIVVGQEFGMTMSSSYGNLDHMTSEETLLVVDWLVRNGYADDETYADIATAHKESTHVQ